MQSSFSLVLQTTIVSSFYPVEAQFTKCTRTKRKQIIREAGVRFSFSHDLEFFKDIGPLLSPFRTHSASDIVKTFQAFL